MLSSVSHSVPPPFFAGAPFFQSPAFQTAPTTPGLIDPTAPVALDDDSSVEWTEEDVVFLHWRLLQEVSDLADPETPLEEKLDTLRWVFTERDKDAHPFSFVSCLRVVGCSPLSPIAYCGLIDPEAVRDLIRVNVKAWLTDTLERYPPWVREVVAHNPDWVESRLSKNPQWINEQLKKLTVQDDMFAC